MPRVESKVSWLAYGAMSKRGFSNALKLATLEQLREALGRAMVRQGRHSPHTARCDLLAARIAELEGESNAPQT